MVRWLYMNCYSLLYKSKYRISSNNSQGRLFFFSHQKGEFIQGRVFISNLFPWLIFNVNILDVRAWVVTDDFCCSLSASSPFGGYREKKTRERKRGPSRLSRSLTRSRAARPKRRACSQASFAALDSTSATFVIQVVNLLLTWQGED